MPSPSQPGQRAPVPAVAEERYSAGLVADPLGSRVVFRGTISTASPTDVLNPFVDALHAQLVQSGQREVRVDFRELEFCNSSGFKSFVRWIQQVQALPEGQRYRLRFVSSPERKWQRTSLLALSCFAPGLVEIG